MDEQDEGLDRLTDLDVTWRFDLHAFLRERAHRRGLPPAMLATGQQKRWTCLKGARWTPPRSRQGGPNS